MADTLVGSRSQLKVDFENGLGTLKGSQTPKTITFVSESISGTQNLITNPSIRADGNRPAPVNGNITAGGQLQVVADRDSAGWWLKLFFHAVTDTGGAPPYIHTYKWDISGVTFQSASIDVKLGTSIYKYIKGARVKKIGMKFLSEGFVLFTIDLVALSATAQTSATLTGGTPTDWTASPLFDMLQLAAADMKFGATDGSPAVAATTWISEIEIDPNVNITENDYRMGQAGARSGLAVGAMDLGIKMKVAVEGATQMTLMQDTQGQQLDITYTIASNQTLQIVIPEFYIQKTLPNVQNDMGIFVDIEGKAAYNASAGTQFKIVLTNALSAAVEYV